MEAFQNYPQLSKKAIVRTKILPSRSTSVSTCNVPVVSLDLVVEVIKGLPVQNVNLSIILGLGENVNVVVLERKLHGQLFVLLWWVLAWLKRVVQKKSRRVFAVVFCGLPELVHQIFWGSFRSCHMTLNVLVFLTPLTFERADWQRQQPTDHNNKTALKKNLEFSRSFCCLGLEFSSLITPYHLDMSPKPVLSSAQLPVSESPLAFSKIWGSWVQPWVGKVEKCPLVKSTRGETGNETVGWNTAGDLEMVFRDFRKTWKQLQVLVFSIISCYKQWINVLSIDEWLDGWLGRIGTGR